VNRREFLSTALLALPALRCATERPDPLRLTARHTAPTQRGPSDAVVPFGFGGARDGILYAAADEGAPRPLLLLLHGAGGQGARIFMRVQPGIPPIHGLVVVAPDSRGPTWDIARSAAGPDARFIDDVLSNVFDRYAIDERRIAVCGHSDGASYALALGLTNGDLFSHVLAFSPGFLALKTPSKSKPRVFIAHGRDDEILPFHDSGERIAATLQRSRYDVTFRPFDGGHSLKPEIVAEGLAWWSLRGTRHAAILPSS
jgi:phospholipase/carboxylesterase